MKINSALALKYLRNLELLNERDVRSYRVKEIKQVRLK